MIPIHLKKKERNRDPKIVVNKTITKVTVFKKAAFGELICKQRAKAIAPLIKPEYQQTFISADLIGNGFLTIQ
jgi:hypothetical protein